MIGNMDNTRLIAIIPMKGHSERVKNKNLRYFAGKPLCFYIIETLIECEVVDKVYIDTDSDEIVQKVKGKYSDVNIIKRPERLCGDYVSMNEIIAFDITQMEDSNLYLQTHATNPLLTPKTICKAYEMFMEKQKTNEADSLFSVNRLQTRLYDKNGYPINHRLNELIRTQDLDPVFEENSNIYIFTKRSFYKNNTRIGMNPIMFEMNSVEAIDIDTENDFLLAENIYKVKQEA